MYCDVTMYRIVLYWGTLTREHYRSSHNLHWSIISYPLPFHLLLSLCDQRPTKKMKPNLSSLAHLSATILLHGSCNNNHHKVSAANFNQCPPPHTPPPNSISSTKYTSARTTCTDSCNAAGYCCTLGYGGCNKVPCNTGCHIAFFSSEKQACYDECDVANDGDVNGCYYTVRVCVFMLMLVFVMI